MSLSTSLVPQTQIPFAYLPTTETSELALALGLQVLVSPSEFFVLLRLLAPERRHGMIATWSSRELAEVLHMSRRTVQRALDRLDELRIIRSHPSVGTLPQQHALAFLVDPVPALAARVEHARGTCPARPGPAPLASQFSTAFADRPAVSSRPDAAASGVHLSPTGAHFAPLDPENAPLASGANLAPPRAETPAKQPGPAAADSRAYRKRARSVTHYTPKQTDKTTETKPLRVSECRVEIARSFGESFGFLVPASDWIFHEFEKMAGELQIGPPDLARWFALKAEEKRRRRYPIESPGSVLAWSRTDLVAWCRQQRRGKPPTRSPERSEQAATPPPGSVDQELAHLRESVAHDERFLAEMPEHPQAALIGRQADHKRARIRALESGRGRAATA